MDNQPMQESPPEPERDERDEELSEAELDNVIGGIVAPWAVIECE